MQYKIYKKGIRDCKTADSNDLLGSHVGIKKEKHLFAGYSFPVKQRV